MYIDGKEGEKFHIRDMKKLQPLKRLELGVGLAGKMVENLRSFALLRMTHDKLILPLELSYLGKLLKGLFHDGTDLDEGGLGFAFAAGHQDGLGVGGAD
jgi:hypothetical protein